MPADRNGKATDEAGVSTAERGRVVGEGGGVLALRIVGARGDVGQRRVDRVAAEQMGGDAVGYPEAPGQEGAFVVLDQDQRSVDQRATSRQPGTRPFRNGRDPQHRECQPDGGPPPGDVIVQIAVQPLEPAVQIRHQRNHQQVEVKRNQAEGLRERGKPPPALGSVLPHRSGGHAEG